MTASVVLTVEEADAIKAYIDWLVRPRLQRTSHSPITFKLADEWLSRREPAPR